MKIETNANAALIFISACQLRRVRLSLLRGFRLPQPSQLLNGSTFQLLSDAKSLDLPAARPHFCVARFDCLILIWPGCRRVWVEVPVAVRTRLFGTKSFASAYSGLRTGPW